MSLVAMPGERGEISKMQPHAVCVCVVRVRGCKRSYPQKRRWVQFAKRVRDGREGKKCLYGVVADFVVVSGGGE